MAWVRYDDQFSSNPKVTAVIADDPAALALHVLANTWTNGQKRMGFIPVHQPGVLVCDRKLGTVWAEILVRHRLWHTVAEMCDDCRDEYADAGLDDDGYVVHNAREYRAPARDRATPGTPADLSEKRREAGRKGGLARVAREQAKQAEQASQANGVSKPSNLPVAGVSPVPEPEPESSKADAAQAPPKKTKRGTRIPDDFATTLKPDLVEWAREKCPHVNGRRETEKFVLYWQAKGGREATKLDWDKTWQNWMLNAEERAPRAGPKGHGHGSNGDHRDEWMLNRS